MRNRYSIQALVAYVLLVLVVAGSALFIRREFDQAHDDRCAVAEVTLEAVAVNISILAPSVPEEQMESIGEQLIRVSEGIADACD